MSWKDGDLINTALRLRRLSESIPTSYTVWKSGSTYYAECNIAGGTDQSSTNAETLIESLLENNVHIHFKNAVYEIPSVDGVHVHNYSNILFTGDRATWRHTYAGAAAQIFEVFACENITFANIIFDGNVGVTQVPAGAGLAWLGRVGTNSSRINFYNCDFINAPDCGFVTGIVNFLTFRDCLFDNIGEHPFYLGDGISSRCSNAIIDGCRILNWARWTRGYGVKASPADHTTVSNCYFDPNEDGAGVATSGGPGGSTYGAYGFVVASSIGFHVRDCYMTGSDTAHPAWYAPAIDVELSDATLFDGLYCYDWDLPVFYNEDATHYTTVKNCTFEKMSFNNWPMLTENCVFKDQVGSHVNYLTNNAIMRDNYFVRITATNNSYVLSVASGLKGCIIENNRFINWVPYVIYIHPSAYDTLIKNNYFSGGNAGSTIEGKGTRTRIEGNVWGSDTTNGTQTLVTNDGTDCTLVGNVFDPAMTITLTRSNWKNIRDNNGYVSGDEIPPSYTIYKAGSIYFAKSNIAGGTDYSGEDAATVIQSTIAVGRKIFIKAGSFDLGTTTLFVNDHGITIEGEVSDLDGSAGTILTYSGTGVAIILYKENYRLQKFSLKNLNIVAKGNAKTGINATGIALNGAEDALIDRVTVRDFQAGTGISFGCQATTYAAQIVIRDSFLYQNKYGLYSEGVSADHGVNTVQLLHNAFGGMTGPTVGSVGIQFGLYGGGNLVLGGDVETFETGLVNYGWANSFIKTRTEDVGTHFMISNTATHTFIENHLFVGGGTYVIDLGGTNTKIKNCPTYITENGGYQTLVEASGSFAHGMDAIPTTIGITASGSSTSFYKGAFNTYLSGSTGIWVEQTGSGTIGYYWRTEV